MAATPRVVHCHVPLTVRIAGRPAAADLDRLGDSVRRLLATRLAEFDRVLARPEEPGRGEAACPVVTPAGVVVREPYNPDRERLDGYEVPSYDGAGRPVRVPVRRPGVPGRDWRVLRAVYFRATLRAYLDVVTTLTSDDAGGQGEGPFADRVLYEDIEDTELPVTVWLAETERRTISLGDLLDDLTARATELIRLPPAHRLLVSASAVDAYRLAVARIDPTGTVGALPSMARRNANRYRGRGRASVALYGTWVVFTAVTVPSVGLTDLVDAGPRSDVEMTPAEAAGCVRVDPGRFRDEYGTDLADYGRELAGIRVRTGILALRVRRDTSPARLRYVMEHVFGEDTRQARPGHAVFYRTVLAGDPQAPEVMARAGNELAASLPPLPPRRGPAVAHGRIPAGVVAVYASVQLPVDPETLGRARFAGPARVLAAELREFLRRDTGYSWDRDVEAWLHDRFALPPSVGRPPGGTVFEYVLAELEATGDLGLLFADVLASTSSNVKYYVFELTACTHYARDPRAATFTAEMVRHRLHDNFGNHYVPGVPGGSPGSIDLYGDPELRLLAGVAGEDVLGDRSSTFITESRQKFMKPAALERLRQALVEVRLDLVREMASGRVAATFTADEFLVEVVKRAGVKARITEDDYRTVTVQQSRRVLAVAADDHDGLPSFTITVQPVSREKGTTAWLAAGDPFDVPASAFELAMQMHVVGRFVETTAKVTLVIVAVGAVAAAWELGVVASLIQLGGGGWMVFGSVSLSIAIYVVKVCLGYAEWSAEGFLMAAVDGYLNAVGFRIGRLVTAGLGLRIGMASLTNVWRGIVLEKLLVGVVGGALGAGLQQLAADLVAAAEGEGHPLDGWAYVRKMSWGAVMGVAGEFVGAPLLKRILTRGGAAWREVADLVRQLKADQITFGEIASEMTTALRGLRISLGTFMTEASADGLAAALSRRIGEVLDGWAEGFEPWMQATVARRVLELRGVTLTPAAAQGVAALVRVSEGAGSQEAARQLALQLAEQPAAAVTVLEVLSFLPEADAAALVNRTFTGPQSLLGFVGGLSRYSTEAQRGALALLARAGIVEAAAATLPPGGGDLLARQLESALRLEARLVLAEAQGLRDRANQVLNEAVVADVNTPARATRLLAQAVRLEREAAAREALAADLGRGVDPRTVPARIPDPHIGDDPAALEAELDRAFDRLENEPGGGTGAGHDEIGPQAWIRVRALTPKNAQTMAALVRRSFVSRSGNPVVFRIEGGTQPGARSWELTMISASGDVRIANQGRAYNVNVGSFDRVVEYLMKNRPDGRVKIFEVDAEYLDRLQGIPTPERGTPAPVVTGDPASPTPLAPAGEISDVTGVPRSVDVRAAKDQLQIPAVLISEFGDFVIPGSGRVLDFAPLTERGKVAR